MFVHNHIHSSHPKSAKSPRLVAKKAHENLHSPDPKSFYPVASRAKGLRKLTRDIENEAEEFERCFDEPQAPISDLRLDAVFTPEIEHKRKEKSQDDPLCKFSAESEKNKDEISESNALIGFLEAPIRILRKYLSKLSLLPAELNQTSSIVNSKSIELVSSFCLSFIAYQLETYRLLADSATEITHKSHLCTSSPARYKSELNNSNSCPQIVLRAEKSDYLECCTSHSVGNLCSKTSKMLNQISSCHSLFDSCSSLATSFNPSPEYSDNYARALAYSSKPNCNLQDYSNRSYHSDNGGWFREVQTENDGYLDLCSAGARQRAPAAPLINQRIAPQTRASSSSGRCCNRLYVVEPLIADYQLQAKPMVPARDLIRRISASNELAKLEQKCEPLRESGAVERQFCLKQHLNNNLALQQVAKAHKTSSESELYSYTNEQNFKQSSSFNRKLISNNKPTNLARDQKQDSRTQINKQKDNNTNNSTPLSNTSHNKLHVSNKSKCKKDVSPSKLSLAGKF